MAQTAVRMEWTKCDSCQSPRGELCVSIGWSVTLCWTHWNAVKGAVFNQERAIDRGFRSRVEQDLTGEQV